MKCQSEKDKYHMVSFIHGTEEIKQMSKGGKKRGKPSNTLNYREQTQRMYIKCKP